MIKICTWTPINLYFFEGQPLKTRPFRSKTRVIWVQGRYTNTRYYDQHDAVRSHQFCLYHSLVGLKNPSGCSSTSHRYCQFPKCNEGNGTSIKVCLLEEIRKIFLWGLKIACAKSSKGFQHEALSGKCFFSPAVIWMDFVQLREVFFSKQTHFSDSEVFQNAQKTLPKDLCL